MCSDITGRIENPPAFCAGLAQAAQPPGSFDPCGRPPAPSATGPHVSRSQLLSRRRFAPRPSTRTDALRLAPSLSITASHPLVGMGSAFRGLGCACPGEPAAEPHSGTRDLLPGPSLASAFGAQRLQRISVPPDFSGLVPSVHSPLHPSNSALCSARCLTRAGPPPDGPVLLRKERIVLCHGVTTVWIRFTV